MILCSSKCQFTVSLNEGKCIFQTIFLIKVLRTVTKHCKLMIKKRLYKHNNMLLIKIQPDGNYAWISKTATKTLEVLPGTIFGEKFPQFFSYFPKIFLHFPKNVGKNGKIFPKNSPCFLLNKHKRRKMKLIKFMRIEF